MSEKEYATTQALDRVEKNLGERIDHINDSLDRRLDIMEQMVLELKDSHVKLANSLENLEKKINGLASFLSKAWKPALIILVLLYSVVNKDSDLIKVILSLLGGV
jgi:hypothetical protein